MIDSMIKENRRVGLHDCRTNHVEYNNGVMTFYFPNGFDVLDDFLETGKAEMRCHVVDNKYPGWFTVYVFRKNIFGKIIREDWSEKFIAAINGGKYEFEFIYTYRRYHSILFQGWLWFDKRPYHMECELELSVDEIEYTWDESDKPDDTISINC